MKRARWGTVITRVYTVMMDNPTWTNKQIAEAVGTSPEYVRVCQQRMQKVGWLPPCIDV